jgi:hypothetical protein
MKPAVLRMYLVLRTLVLLFSIELMYVLVVPGTCTENHSDDKTSIRSSTQIVCHRSTLPRCVMQVARCRRWCNEDEIISHMELGERPIKQLKTCYWCWVHRIAFSYGCSLWRMSCLSEDAMPSFLPCIHHGAQAQEPAPADLILVEGSILIVAS